MGPDNKSAFFKWLGTAPTLKEDTWFSSPSIKPHPAEIEVIKPEVTGGGGFTYNGMSFKLKAFDEFADYPSKEGETVPPKKTFGKWVPTRKNGKLVADGGVVRRNDSGVPDLDPADYVTMPKSELDKILWNLQKKQFIKGYYPGNISLTPSTKPTKKAVPQSGPVAALKEADLAYKKLLNHAKTLELSLSSFQKNIKPLTHALSLTIPEAVAKNMEKDAVAVYEKYVQLQSESEAEVK